MRAVLRQFGHEFDAALADLSAAVQQDPDDAEAWAWLRAVALGRARNMRTSEMARCRREQAVAADAAVLFEDAAESWLSERKDCLINALHRLTPVQCEILRLRFVDGASSAEIGRALRMTAVSVQKQGHG